MFWKRGARDTPRRGSKEDVEGQHGPIQIERDAERPATILRVATELERRGAEIVELFKEIETERTRAILPIHLRWKEQDFFVEIETRPWREQTVEKVLNAAVALRSSEYAGAGIGLLSAYPAPDKVFFFLEKSPAALFQLDLYGESREDPEKTAAAFVRAVRRRWNVPLDYDLGSLVRAEKLLVESLHEPTSDDEWGGEPPVLDVVVAGLGYYLGEVLRCSNEPQGVWSPSDDWGEALVLELGGFRLDPVGKARAFLLNGARDSVAYYAEYVTEELKSVVSGRTDQA